MLISGTRIERIDRHQQTLRIPLPTEIERSNAVAQALQHIPLQQVPPQAALASPTAKAKLSSLAPMPRPHETTQAG
jgi:hypothetical protein